MARVRQRAQKSRKQATKRVVSSSGKRKKTAGRRSWEDLTPAQQQGVEANLKAYVKFHQNVDNQLFAQFNRLLGWIQRAVAVNLIIRIVLALIAISIVLIGLHLVWLSTTSTDIQRLIGGGSIALGLMSLVVLASRDSTRGMCETTAAMVKMNVIFVGYLRQINQIDIVFRRAIHTNPESLEKTLDSIQNITQGASLEIEEND